MRRLLGLALLLPLAVFACGRGGTGTIAGTVEAPGGVIPGATVEAYLNPGTATGEKPLSATVTDETGHFTMALPRGTYYLAARAENPGGGPRLTGAPAEPLVIRKGGETVAALIRVRAKGGVEGETVMLTGRVLREGVPAAGAAISSYLPGHATFSGPAGQLASGVSGEDGRFSFPVPAVRQGVTARLRTGEVKVGALGPGDLSSGDPRVIEPNRGEPFDLGDLSIRPLSPDKLKGRAGSTGGVAVEGMVTDGEGKPLAGLFAMAYRNPDMTARPAAISPPSGPDGRFRIPVPGPGTYYLGVRSRPGGPVTPGETMGSYQETPDHSIVVGTTAVTGVVITAERML